MKRIVGGLVLALTLTLAGSAMGEVVATARSPEGTFPEFRVVLDAVGAPMAVANFMGLADGSQAWVDQVTGRVRGGEGDAFYDGMVFDFGEGNVAQGGLRGVAGEGGEVKYTAGPGYTVVGKTNEAWSAFEWGTLALSESGGPHCGGGEVGLLLTNGVTAWTVFGQVVAGDEEGAQVLVDRVAGGTVTEVAWEVNAGGATEEEIAALEDARRQLPTVEGKAVRLRAGGDGFEFEWPGASWMGILASADLCAGFECVANGWGEAGHLETLSFGWEDMGLTNSTGFVAATRVAYPRWAGTPFAGKWRMAMEHTGQMMLYEFDFDAKTGTAAVVVGGETTETWPFTQVSTWREGGNCIGVYYGRGLSGIIYHLGFAEEGATGGRFQSTQVSPFGVTGTDNGMFEMAEGWEDLGKTADHRAHKTSRRSGGTGGTTWGTKEGVHAMRPIKVTTGWVRRLDCPGEL